MNFLSASFIGLIPLCAILLLFPTDSMSGEKTDAKDNGSKITNKGKDINAPRTTKISDANVNGSQITMDGKDINAPRKISDANVNGSQITNEGENIEVEDAEVEDAKSASVDAGGEKFIPRRGNENKNEELSTIDNAGGKNAQGVGEKNENKKEELSTIDNPGGSNAQGVGEKKGNVVEELSTISNPGGSKKKGNVVVAPTKSM